MHFLDGFTAPFAGCQSFHLVGGGKQSEPAGFVGLFDDVDAVLGVAISARANGGFQKGGVRLSRGKENEDHGEGGATSLLDIFVERIEYCFCCFT
mmetsp:Transcript_131367/g.195681  ORF Transcript_131367/g.195681 Transcript_131367/m.195681 type:complete len:95 (-) Transcript_131367:112-396(-)